MSVDLSVAVLVRLGSPECILQGACHWVSVDLSVAVLVRLGSPECKLQS